VDRRCRCSCSGILRVSHSSKLLYGFFSLNMCMHFTEFHVLLSSQVLRTFTSLRGQVQARIQRDCYKPLVF
jgi:hypothetical protein